MAGEITEEGRGDTAVCIDGSGPLASTARVKRPRKTQPDLKVSPQQGECHHSLLFYSRLNFSHKACVSDMAVPLLDRPGQMGQY